jgi:hypothetical protein
MAKAKKEKAATAPKAAAPKAEAQKAASKARKAPKPAAPPPPLIDTSLAAQAAAKMVANRDLLAQGTGEKRQSGSFKQLKDQLLKPATQGPGGILQPKESQKKFNPILGRNQVGHNQTFGADVNRTGVPRRTGG